MGESYGDIKSAMPRLGRSFSSLPGYMCLEDKREIWAGVISMCRAAEAKDVNGISQEE